MLMLTLTLNRLNRGRLTGLVVQVPSRVMAPEGEVILVRAEWSVRTVWADGGSG